ncbi:hypothetical protein ANCCAN_03743 [Ancylostoma caninum]|uniref:Uncharacterized protein n=1 Tax=Ancylostoma caninum TaxID=29170 RepID=A0A368H2Z5_ANCCA|nr:hypothetical protein ANCCAN_03743 [Ancylostoma caninum]
MEMAGNGQEATRLDTLVGVQMNQRMENAPICNSIPDSNLHGSQMTAPTTTTTFASRNHVIRLSTVI